MSLLLPSHCPAHNVSAGAGTWAWVGLSPKGARLPLSSGCSSGHFARPSPSGPRPCLACLCPAQGLAGLLTEQTGPGKVLVSHAMSDAQRGSSLPLGPL